MAFNRQSPQKASIAGITCQVNPSDWTKEKSINLTAIGGVGCWEPQRQYDGAEPTTISVQLYFDSKFVNTVDVDSQIAAIEAAAAPPDPEDAQFTGPSPTQFSVGPETYEVYITSYTIKRSAFSVGMQTVRATVDLTMEFAYPQAPSSGSGSSSISISHSAGGFSL